MVKYLKFMQEKIKTSNKISIKQVEKIICINLKYAKVSHYGLMLMQIWQKLKSMKFFAKKRSQQ